MTHQNAYNEFIADFVERHGHNKATRDEAHEWADKIVEMARAVSLLTKKYANDMETAWNAADELCCTMIDDMEIDSKDEARFLLRQVIVSEFSA